MVIPYLYLDKKMSDIDVTIKTVKLADYNHNGIDDNYEDNYDYNNHNNNIINDNDNFIPLFRQKNVEHQFVDAKE